MGLVVWLPLTKDLRQQGLSNVTVTNNGATFNSAGKLGGCYEFASGKRIQTTLPTSTNLNAKAISFACWVNIASWNSSYDALMSIADGTGWQQSRATLCRNNTTSTLTWNIADGSTSTRVSTTTSLSTNTWYHIVCTYDGTSLKIYLNGVLNNSAAATLSINYAGTFNIGGWSGNNYPLNAKLNDVRIYSHCLSPMEVKELAKGLVLHYPLNRGGWGQENLMRNTYRVDGDNSNQIYGWMRNGYGDPEIVIKDGSECIHLQASCSGAYTPSIVSASKLILEYGVEYVISCDLMYDKEIKVNPATPIHYHNGSSDTINEFNLTNVNNGYGFNFKSISPVANTIVPANTWQHYEQHIVAKSSATDSSLPYLTYRAFIYGSNRTTSEAATVNMWLKNWKIEKGSIATPWCPNSSDTLATTMGLNSTTEYDCSGFCNNGTRTGTFTWTSDTPKYSVSQYFNGSSYILTNSGTFSWFNFDKCTVAVWMKPTTTPSSWAGTFGIAHNNSSSNKSFVIGNYGGKFTMQSANGNWVNVQASNLPINEWHHCVATLDETTIKMYFDGELVNTYTINWGNTTVASDTRVQVGNDLPGSDEIYVGYYSDARIYATALSADDVKSLYQNSAYIDSSGNVYGAVHTEV